MTDMQQILAGMSELNERVQNAEAWATESERQAQATQQELARSQAGVKGNEQGHYNRSKGSARVRRSTSLSRSKAVTTSGENWLEFFAVGLDVFLVVRWQRFTNTFRDTATIQQPSWTWRSRH